MARKTEEAEKFFSTAARILRVSVPTSASGNTASDMNTFIITRNQNEIARDLAFIAEGHVKMAQSLRDIFDVVARIEAKLNKR